jgi:E3 ubiquitin-protein ligase BRE1
MRLSLSLAAPQVIITKCSHSFCRACIRANLDTRLRKCPACGRAFGEGDVKPLYLT